MLYEGEGRTPAAFFSYKRHLAHAQSALESADESNVSQSAPLSSRLDPLIELTRI